MSALAKRLAYYVFGVAVAVFVFGWVTVNILHRSRVLLTNHGLYSDWIGVVFVAIASLIFVVMGVIIVMDAIRRFTLD